MWLAQHSRFNMLAAALVFSSDLMAMDKQNNTALNYAICAKNMGLANMIMLRAYELQVQTQLLDSLNSDGDYPLTLAVRCRDRAMVQFLLFSGSRILQNSGAQALHQAAHWDQSTGIFADLMADLCIESKYSVEELNHLLNAATTFCDVSENYHNLWDYLLISPHNGKHDRMMETAMQLVHARGLSAQVTRSSRVACSGTV
jgi:hypothetical protein